MIMGEEEEGKAMMGKLCWKQNTGRADRSWKNIKRSLHGVNVATLDTYLTAYATTRATINCHRDDINVRCATCFYYKQITKFFNVLISLLKSMNLIRLIHFLSPMKKTN
ncbi:LOW QUALITY PROTEIN: hypothetical protein HID58_071335 [Brassica napus]|uniref:Uncharacterized protein n=1 Tax=Brassica napus TaxID=3708 RepID=A0ABQ7Z1E2_BRANA|nr:LOW QUALITY PROTEIN: hypothetical protein HID58_071335 [Brassica napus]